MAGWCVCKKGGQWMLCRGVFFLSGSVPLCYHFTKHPTAGHTTVMQDAKGCVGHSFNYWPISWGVSRIYRGIATNETESGGLARRKTGVLRRQFPRAAVLRGSLAQQFCTAVWQWIVTHSIRLHGSVAAETWCTAFVAQ